MVDRATGRSWPLTCHAGARAARPGGRRGVALTVSCPARVVECNCQLAHPSVCSGAGLEQGRRARPGLDDAAAERCPGDPVGRAHRSPRWLFRALPPANAHRAVAATANSRRGGLARLSGGHLLAALCAIDSAVHGAGRHGGRASQQGAVCFRCQALGAFRRPRTRHDDVAAIWSYACCPAGRLVCHRPVSPPEHAHSQAGISLVSGIGIFCLGGHRRRRHVRGVWSVRLYRLRSFPLADPVQRSGGVATGSGVLPALANPLAALSRPCCGAGGGREHRDHPR